MLLFPPHLLQSMTHHTRQIFLFNLLCVFMTLFLTKEQSFLSVRNILLNVLHLAFFLFIHSFIWGLPWWLSVKESACNAGDHLQCRRCRLDLWVGRITWRRKWQPTAVFLPGKFHGQRSQVGYTVHGVTRVRHDLVTKPSPLIYILCQQPVFSARISHVCSVTHSRLTFYDPMDCSPPGSSVHGIFQAKILEWVAISSSRGSS